MTTREIAIAKLQQLPDSLLQQVSDFIDFLIYKRQPTAVTEVTQPKASKQWAEWFDAVDHLPLPQPDISEDGDYQSLLLAKYRKQGLEL